MTDLPPGVHRLGDADVNFWLLVRETGLVLVDAGLPRHWAGLVTAVTALGRSPAEITDVVLTHGHPDHLGLAARLQRTSGATVWAHPAEVDLVAAPLAARRHARPERSLLPYVLRRPTALRGPAHLLRMGAARTQPVTAVRTFDDGEHLDVPGGLVAVHTPGHTPGSASFLLPDGAAAFTGDALVTHDVATGRRGPCVICRAFTHDGAQAERSLRRLGEMRADSVLTGHGEPFAGSLAAAAEEALAYGVR
jgi:glyoxylase-like metal-dependent hydrolase (beta-lactamase superfamily II)